MRSETDANGGSPKPLEAFADIALCSAWSHDGARVAAGDWTGEVRVWTAADGKRLGALSLSPPGREERLAAAMAELAARKAEADAAAKADAASRAAAEKADAAVKAA